MGNLESDTCVAKGYWVSLGSIGLQVYLGYTSIGYAVCLGLGPNAWAL